MTVVAGFVIGCIIFSSAVVSYGQLLAGPGTDGQFYNNPRMQALESALMQQLQQSIEQKVMAKFNTEMEKKIQSTEKGESKTEEKVPSSLDSADGQQSQYVPHSRSDTGSVPAPVGSGLSGDFFLAGNGPTKAEGTTDLLTPPATPVQQRPPPPFYYSPYYGPYSYPFQGQTMQIPTINSYNPSGQPSYPLTARDPALSVNSQRGDATAPSIPTGAYFPYNSERPFSSPYDQNIPPMATPQSVLKTDSRASTDPPAAFVTNAPNFRENRLLVLEEMSTATTAVPYSTSTVPSAEVTGPTEDEWESYRRKKAGISSKTLTTAVAPTPSVAAESRQLEDGSQSAVETTHFRYF